MFKKILVVDDSAALHHTYQITLSKYQCPILTATSGQNGLDLLRQNPDVNLLIVDMYMPFMSGLEFINRVKEQDKFNNIPIIAVLMKEQEGYSQESTLLAEGFLKKPFTSTEVHSEIERLFPGSNTKRKPTEL
jgi:CheY-like chemotaxis protein